MGLIFICQNKDKQHVPAVLSDYHIIHYDINNISRMTKDAEGALSQLIARGRSSESRVFRSICYVDRKSSDLEARYLKATSGDTSKPASRGHFKTGQLSASRTAIFLPYRH